MFAVSAGCSQFDHSHAQCTALLKKHVVLIDGGKASPMGYAKIASARATLKNYLKTLTKVSDADFKGWSKNQQLAFLINAYNAHLLSDNAGQQKIIRDGKAGIRHLDYDRGLNTVKP